MQALHPSRWAYLVDLTDYVFGNVLTNNAAELLFQVYPTAVTTDFLGTNENETFNCDSAGPTPVSFTGAAVTTTCTAVRAPTR
ncbi:hypothetical protein AB5I41_07765 [Sphingomonas sp. MMS24-JH45]